MLCTTGTAGGMLVAGGAVSCEGETPQTALQTTSDCRDTPMLWATGTAGGMVVAGGGLSCEGSSQFKNNHWVEM